MTHDRAERTLAEGADWLHGDKQLDAYWTHCGDWRDGEQRALSRLASVETAEQFLALTKSRASGR